MFFWIESPTNLSYVSMVNMLDKKLDIEQVKKLLIERKLTGLNERGEALFPTFRQVTYCDSYNPPGIQIRIYISE